VGGAPSITRNRYRTAPFQTNRAGDLGSPLNIDFLTRVELSLRVEEAAANAQAGNPIVELALGPPTPVGEKLNVDARMSALFDRSHALAGQLPLRSGRGLGVRDYRRRTNALT